MRWGYVYVLAVLCHGPAGNIDSLRSELLRDGVVADRLERRLRFYHFPYFCLDGMGRVTPIGAVPNSAGEKVFEFKHALRCLNEFVVAGPGDRGLVKSKCLRDFTLSERVKFTGAGRHER